MNCRPTLLVSTLLASTLTLTACGGSSSADAPSAPPPPFEATIQRTSYGVPHITARNLKGAAYGLAYAYAQDNLCLLADQVLTVSGERSKNLGPDAAVRAGSTLPNIKSDFVWRYLLDDTALRANFSNISQEAKDLIAGYVAGYNRYVNETVGKLPAPCTGAAWVRPITDLDMFRLISEKAVQSGYGVFVAGIHDASPPTGAKPLAAPVLSAKSAAAQFAAAFAERPELGSNGYAFGKDATASGSGVLLGNPHFPWSTTNRFYQFHLIVPGSLDVMGAALGGFPMVNIGFNRDVAWTHTVSTGRRFTLLELAMTDGTSYTVDGVTKPLIKKTITVDAKDSDGVVRPRCRDFYATAQGPLLVGSGLSWSLTKAFAIRDANIDNARMIDQWLELARAKSVAEIQASLRRINGLPWVNTLATDRAGTALYADISVTPNVSSAKLAACATSPMAQAFLASRNYLLDGSKSSCDWDVDAASGRALYPPSAMPQLVRSDYVANSNESGWLANPADLSATFSPVIGPMAKEQSLRTRLAFRQIADRLAGSDGLAGNKFDIDKLETIFFNARAHAAELTVDALVALCRTTPTATSTAGKLTDLKPACDALAGWNRRMNFDAVGVPVFREFWRSARNIPSLWSVPFSATDPVNTPRGLNTGNPTVATALLRALADSVNTLAANGVALDAPLRQVQYVMAGSTRIAIDGGDEFEGPFNKMTPAAGLTAAGYTPIVSGSSYVQAVSFDAEGPVARGILTYSQSTDPSSPYASDQTQLYATGKWAKLPFKDSDISADPNLKAIKISE